MIIVKGIYKEVEKHSCDNCNEVTGLNFVFSFKDKNNKEFNKLTLCEDCSCAISRLFTKSMVGNKSFKYDKNKDEISEIKYK